MIHRSLSVACLAVIALVLVRCGGATATPGEFDASTEAGGSSRGVVRLAAAVPARPAAAVPALPVAPAAGSSSSGGNGSSSGGSSSSSGGGSGSSSGSTTCMPACRSWEELLQRSVQRSLCGSRPLWRLRDEVQRQHPDLRQRQVHGADVLEQSSLRQPGQLLRQLLLRFVSDRLLHRRSPERSALLYADGDAIHLSRGLRQPVCQRPQREARFFARPPGDRA